MKLTDTQKWAIAYVVFAIASTIVASFIDANMAKGLFVLQVVFISAGIFGGILLAYLESDQ